ncbi:MAG: hypothetical protein RI958_2349 [Actinomycetota bacterium]
MALGAVLVDHDDLLTPKNGSSVTECDHTASDPTRIHSPPTPYADDMNITRTRLAVSALALTAAALVTSCSSTDPVDDPAATGRELVTEFLTILQSDDPDTLEDFLADSFQLQRADGTGATKAEYVADAPTIDTFTISDTLTAVHDGDLLTVRWAVVIEETIDGAEYSEAEAPRLSTFVREDDDWHLVSHANFNTPS